MEFDSLDEESYSALLLLAGNIGVFFVPLFEEVRKTMMDAAYKTNISSWRSILSHYFDLFPSVEKEREMTSTKTIVGGAPLAVNKGKSLIIPFS